LDFFTMGGNSAYFLLEAFDFLQEAA